MPSNARNGSENKVLPNTDTQIESALSAAKLKNDSAGAETVLTPSTIARLNAIEPLFSNAKLQTAAAKAHSTAATGQKEKARENLLLYISHFLQVFNMGIKRGKYLPADRALFGMDIHSEVLPRLHSESDLETVAAQIVQGEAIRTGQGKVAVVNPSAAEVEAALSEFKTAVTATLPALDALMAAQKQVRDLYKEARETVKDVWYEVEMHYRKTRRERMRKLAREWGVRYERKGGYKAVKGIVTDAATGQPLSMVKVKFANGKNKTLTDAQGHFTLKTNLWRKQTLLATRSGYQPAELETILKEGEENVCSVAMSREE